VTKTAELALVAKTAFPSCFSPSFLPIESRSRMISFRLTEEEHERFRQLCFTHGIRSVSELARVAMNNYFVQPTRVPQDAIESRIVELENRLHLLALEFQKINQQETVRSFPARRYSAT
jgi:hypothetical protein